MGERADLGGRAAVMRVRLRFAKRGASMRATPGWERRRRNPQGPVREDGPTSRSSGCLVAPARVDRGPWHASNMVRIQPLTKPWAEALVQGDDVFAKQFGVAVAEGWAVFPEVMSFVAKVAETDASQEWGLHLIFDDDGALVGNCGWKGPPVQGEAELGYAVAPGRRGRGVATEAVRELASRAGTAGVHMLVAHTLGRDSSSTAVLARSGFVKTETLIDPGEGQVWRWERSFHG